MGFTKARKHLKALLLRKTEDTFSEDENVDPQTRYLNVIEHVSLISA